MLRLLFVAHLLVISKVNLHSKARGLALLAANLLCLGTSLKLPLFVDLLICWWLIYNDLYCPYRINEWYQSTIYIYNIPERGGNKSQQSLQEQRPFFVSRVHDKFGRLLECPATDVLVVLVVGVGGGHVVARSGGRSLFVASVVGRSPCCFLFVPSLPSPETAHTLFWPCRWSNGSGGSSSCRSEKDCAGSAFESAAGEER